ncbi:telomere-associated protein Tap [Streptomyces sp. NPDC056486]|uniref:telomere-associated protein Tap n=1 Tax=Streptomyces sp. NPDC056486 TaxID=3345835 RepID=UPI0036986338
MTVTETEYTAPLVVVDAEGGALIAHRPDLQRVDLPSDVTDLSSAADWALGYGLGRAKLSSKYGEDLGPLLVLTESALEFLGLPATLEDRRQLRVPEGAPSVKALAEAGWTLSRAGLAPWTHIFRDRDNVRIASLPWGAFDDNNQWGGIADGAHPSALAYALGLYAERVITPSGSTASTGTHLMTALRPPKHAAYERGTGRMHRVPVPGSISEPVDPAPPEAPDEHPLAADRTREQAKDPAHVLLVEEAMEWFREATQEEARLPYVVGLDLNVAFLAAANRLTVGTGPAVYTDGPAFDKKIPGTWLCDFSGAVLRTKHPRTKEWIELDPRLPSPFTPNGEPPTGPAWYATPTLAYAAELGIEVRPLAAWLRPDAGGFLDLWHNRLRAAYMDTLADLGIVPGMDEALFISSMATLKERDPEAVALLSAIKLTAKGAIGKMRERPRERRSRENRNAPWAALKRVTWSPHIRAMVISASRTGEHRKIVKTWAHTGLAPLAVLADCIVYPSAHPTARAVVPRKEDGSPLPGGFQLGPNPAFVKEEGVQSMEWFAEMVAKESNPGRHIKGTNAALGGE